MKHSDKSLQLARWLLFGMGFFLILILIPTGRTALTHQSLSSDFPEIVAPAVAISALITLLIVLVLSLTLRRWLPAFIGGEIECARESQPPFKFSRLSLTLIFPITLAAFLTAPRLEHSLWGDEQFAASFYIHGRYERDPVRSESHTPEFKPATWTEALFLTDADNHWLNTLTARISLSAWQEIFDSQAFDFSEKAIRIFPFLAGLGALAAWFAVARRTGLSTGAALGVSIILALHPWFLRHLTESRGYPFLLFLTPLAIIVAGKALTKNTGFPWIAFGLLQFLLLYAWPGSLLSVVAFNLAILVTIITRDEARKNLGVRWLISSLLSIALLLFLIAPTIPQFWTFLQSDSLKAPIEPYWFRNLCAHFLAGIDAIPYAAETPSPFYLTLQEMNPLPVTVSSLSLVGLFVIGAKSLRHHPLARLTAMTTLIPAIILAAYAIFSRNHLFFWYLLPALPCAVIGVVAGVDFLFRKNRPFAVSLALITATAWLAVAIPQIRILRNHDTDPLRQSVLATRPNLDPEDPVHDQILTAHLYSAPLLYDPHGYPFSMMHQENAAYPGLIQLMRLADQKKLPLTINVGFPQQARVYYPDLMKVIEDPEKFEAQETLHGIEPQFTRTLYRYRGDPLLR